MKNQGTCFNGVGAEERRHVTRAAVHPENGGPTLRRLGRSNLPADNFERAVLEMKGDNLRRRGHPRKEGDRGQSKPDFKQGLLLYGSAMDFRSSESLVPMRTRAFESSSRAKCITPLSSPIFSNGTPPVSITVGEVIGL